MAKILWSCQVTARPLRPRPARARKAITVHLLFAGKGILRPDPGLRIEGVSIWDWTGRLVRYDPCRATRREGVLTVTLPM